jgi:hypothetical protein
VLHRQLDVLRQNRDSYLRRPESEGQPRCCEVIVRQNAGKASRSIWKRAPPLPTHPHFDLDTHKSRR